MYIHNAINQANSQYVPIASPIQAIGQRYTIQDTKSKLEKKLKCKVTPNQIAIETGISTKRQAEVHKTDFKFIPYSDPSYDKISDIPHQKSHITKFVSGLIYHQKRIEEKVESKIIIEKALRSKRLEKKKKKEKIVILTTFGLNNGVALTLKETGDLLNITKERVRQIQEKALRKLRHPSISKGLKN